MRRGRRQEADAAGQTGLQAGGTKHQPGADISDGRMTGMELLRRAHVTQLGHHRVAVRVCVCVCVVCVCVCVRERERESEREPMSHNLAILVLLSKSAFSEHIL